MGFVLAAFWLTHCLIFKEASLQFSSQMELFLNFKCLRQQEVLIKEGFCMPSILIGDSWGSLVWLAIINDLFCSCLCFLLIMAACLIVFWCNIFICTKFEWNRSWSNIFKKTTISAITISLSQLLHLFSSSFQKLTSFSRTLKPPLKPVTKLNQTQKQNKEPRTNNNHTWLTPWMIVL